MKNIVLALGALLLLSGCAAPLKSNEMMPQFDFYDTVKSKKYEDNIFIRHVDVHKGAGGMTPVTPEEFRSALVSSFRQADLYETEDKAKYFLDAAMRDMKKPMLGLNMTVTASADYKIYRKSNDGLMLEESVSVPCTKGIGDAFNGEIRLRLASGCAVGENITHLIKVISQN